MKSSGPTANAEVQAGLHPAEWAARLSELPLQCRDVYFTPEYHALSEAGGDGEAFASLACSPTGKMIVAGMRSPIGAAPAPCWDLQSPNGYGGPVGWGNWNAQELSRVWDGWKGTCREVGMVAAFFRLHPLLRNEALLPADAEVRVDRKTVFVDLSAGVEEAWRGAQSQHRNMVSKGKREAVTVRWNEPGDWIAFEQLYGDAMRRMNAPERLHFSHRYFQLMRSVPGTEIAAVRRQQELECAAIFMFGPAWGHYHLSARAPASANHLTSCILQSAFERAAERGLRGVHLGGGRTSSQDDSLLKFKASTGGKLVDFKVALVVTDRHAFDDLCDRWQSQTQMRPNWFLGYRQPHPAGTGE